jgi:DNA-binding XRE family transcriptional regulator
MKNTNRQDISDFPKDWILAAKMYEDLGTLQKTADALGIKLQTVRGRLNRMGVKLRSPGHQEGATILITAKECRELRFAQGLSQTKLADLCGVSRRTINLFENGKRIPTETTQNKIIAVLNGEAING